MNFSELAIGTVFALEQPLLHSPQIGPAALARWVKSQSWRARPVGSEELFDFPDVAVLTELASGCDACRSRGYWLRFDPANRPQLIRCEQCRVFSNNVAAARCARADGVQCSVSPPHVIRNIRDVARLFPMGQDDTPRRCIVLDPAWPGDDETAVIVIPPVGPVQRKPPRKTERAEPVDRDFFDRPLRYLDLGDDEL